LTATSPTPRLSNTADVAQSVELGGDISIIPITENTVSFTRSGDKTYMRYHNKVYDDSKPADPQPLTDVKTDQLTWYGLVNPPADTSLDEFMFDEFFSFKVAPDKKQFIFVMRWGNKNTPTSQSYYVYHYNPAKKEKLTLAKKFTPEQKGESDYQVPKIYSISSDNKFAAFTMYGCWNCGGHPPETLLMKLDTYETRRIGKTSYLAWKENGAYEYKELKEIPCVGESMGPCIEKPENLPMKTGQF
jgi:hypothetical protein